MPTTPHLLLGQLRHLLPEAVGGGQAMSAPTDSLYEQLSAEFTLAAMNRLRARFQLERRDSPENRAAADAAADEVDAVLDMYLESRADCS